MSKIKIIIEKQAVKYLKSLQHNQRRLIMEAINGLVEYPPKGDIKLIKGYKDGRYRLRVGKYRIIYKYDKEGQIAVLVIMNIGSRGDVYK